MASRLFRSSLRALKVRPTTMLLRSTQFQSEFVHPRLVQPQLFQRAFTINLPRFNNGEVDSELVHQLDEEIQLEATESESEAPEFIKEFLDTTLFMIGDEPGSNKVTLTRNFGSEHISIIFSASEAYNSPMEEEVDNPEENKNEETEVVKEEEVTQEEEEEDYLSFPVRAVVRIQKPGKGDLIVSTVSQDGYLHIQGIRYFKEGQADLDDLSKDIGEQRQDLYLGPGFEDLDETLKLTFAKYLEERGIDTALATFLPDYVDYKEQKEYLYWLEHVKGFVSA